LAAQNQACNTLYAAHAYLPRGSGRRAIQQPPAVAPVALANIIPGISAIRGLEAR